MRNRIVRKDELIINLSIPNKLSFDDIPAKDDDIEVFDSQCSSGNQ